MNGNVDEEESENLSDGGSNGIFPPPRDGRSVSSGIHDRSRSTPAASAAASGAVAKRSSSKNRHHAKAERLGGTQPQAIGRSHPPGSFVNQQAHHQAGSTGSSPSTARETFLNYFFGQNGPGPIAGSSVERAQIAHGHQGSGISEHRPHQQQGFVPVGRDVSGAEPVLASGLMAGKRSLDGNNAAYDMKSLGKHIEAVGLIYFCVGCWSSC